MAWPSDELHFSEVVAFALRIVTIIFFDEFSHLLLVILTNKLSNNFLSDITTNIFIVIAFAPHLLLPHFFEDV